MKLYELQKKSPWTTKRVVARKIKAKLIWDRADLEGRDLTMYEIDVAFDLKEVIYWAPPTQLEGICNPTLKLYFENICLRCVEDIASHLNSQLLINECLDLIYETRKLDDLTVKKLARIHLEVYFDKNYFS